MLVSAIAAMDLGRVIGVANGLPWHLPADLARFRSLTVGKPVVMGRKTYETVGRPLPKRRNLVVSGRKDFEAPGCEVVHSLETALSLAEQSGAGEVMILGGGVIYTEALPRCDRMYLSIVAAHVPGDTFFPDFDEHDWVVSASEDLAADDRHRYGHRYLQLDRAGSPHAAPGAPPFRFASLEALSRWPAYR